MMDDPSVAVAAAAVGSGDRLWRRVWIDDEHFDRDRDTRHGSARLARGDPGGCQGACGPQHARAGRQDGAGVADVPAAGAGLYCEPNSDATTTSLDGFGRQWSRVRWIVAFRCHVLNHCRDLKLVLSASERAAQPAGARAHVGYLWWRAVCGDSAGAATETVGRSGRVEAED
ncbi:hypothetical protein DFJ73DRAFT_858070 [Zopfochytrium polystomum]|nr:hypothetical protein DFJ73DRAFT_858070 [Zopfochytrium polystomum]